MVGTASILDYGPAYNSGPLLDLDLTDQSVFGAISSLLLSWRNQFSSYLSGRKLVWLQPFSAEYLDIQSVSS